MGIFDFLTNHQKAPNHIRVGENGECIQLTKGEARKAKNGYEGDKKTKRSIGCGETNLDDYSVDPSSYL